MPSIPLVFVDSMCIFSGYQQRFLTVIIVYVSSHGILTVYLYDSQGKNAPVSRMYPINRFYGGNGLGNVFGYGFNGYDHRMNGRWGPPLDSKYNPRGRGNGFFGYGNEIQDGFSELNRGPRAGRSKNQKAAGTAPVFDLKGQNLSSIGNENSSVTLDREQYNGDDFPDKHSDARFFVIKSYSEDDIHKSIKYNVWTSTPNGNKKLDGGYQEAQEKDGGCPVFLFYSVSMVACVGNLLCFAFYKKRSLPSLVLKL